MLFRSSEKLAHGAELGALERQGASDVTSLDNVEDGRAEGCVESVMPFLSGEVVEARLLGLNLVDPRLDLLAALSSVDDLVEHLVFPDAEVRRLRQGGELDLLLLDGPPLVGHDLDRDGDGRDLLRREIFR